MGGSTAGWSTGDPCRRYRHEQLRLTTIARRSGQERSVIIGYLEDGPDLVHGPHDTWAMTSA
jgi:hypothetical protein